MNKSFSAALILAVAFILGALAQAAHYVDVSMFAPSKVAAAPAKELPVLHPVGETVTVNGYAITLNNVFFDSGNLSAEFTVDNTSLDTLNLLTTSEFSMRDMDGNKLEQVYCGKFFGGKVAAGDKLKGRICWQEADPSKGLKIYYTPSHSDSLVLWKVY